MEKLLVDLQQMGVGFWLLFIPLFLLVWFLPTLLAVFFNSQQLKLIALANIPAGLSVIAWIGCVVWACTGKLWQKKSSAPATLS